PLPLLAAINKHGFFGRHGLLDRFQAVLSMLSFLFLLGGGGRKPTRRGKVWAQSNCCGEHANGKQLHGGFLSKEKARSTAVKIFGALELKCKVNVNLFQNKKVWNYLGGSSRLLEIVTASVDSARWELE